MKHEALPQTMTAEQLGEWLVDNNIDKKYHEDDSPYSEEDIKEFEHNSSVASRSLDRLDALDKEIKELLNNGCEEPIDKTIPPTKGRKILKKNREWADTQIEQGFKIEEVVLYGIPYAKTGLILYFDIEGNVWDSYETDMTPEQKEKYTGLFEQEQSTNTIGNITKDKTEKKKPSKPAKKKAADANKEETLELGAEDQGTNPDDQIKDAEDDDSPSEDPNAGKGDETPQSDINWNEEKGTMPPKTVKEEQEDIPSQEQEDSIVSASPVKENEGGPDVEEETF